LNVGSVIYSDTYSEDDPDNYNGPKDFDEPDNFDAHWADAVGDEWDDVGSGEMDSIIDETG
jgi:hypothetical protein